MSIILPYGMFGSLSLPINNQTKAAGGIIKRYGVGDTLNPPDAVPVIRIPCRPGFFTFSGTALGGSQAIVQHGGVENVTKVEITAIKITGIVANPLPDVVALRFTTPSSVSLKHKEYTSVSTMPDDCLFVPIANTGINYIQYGTPLILYQIKDGDNINSLNLNVTDLLGNPVVYANIYIWCMVHTLNWQ
jgi:hypothetical protein